MLTYRSNTFIPELVSTMKKLAENQSFNGSCMDAAGRLLAVLSGQVKQGKILEIGTGLGVGSAWILSAIQPHVQFVSVDLEEHKVKLVRNNLNHPQATFICGDWKELIKSGPFQFVFADAAAAKSIEGELLIDILEVGGLLFMDDFTPEEHWPEQWRGKRDPVREFWLNHENLSATEIFLTPTSSAILAAKNNMNR
jgi:predicted O-methyltransferase YrrM